MIKSNKIVCSGENCPLDRTCLKYLRWLSSDNDADPTIIPLYRDGKCIQYEQKEFYGG